MVSGTQSITNSYQYPQAVNPSEDSLGGIVVPSSSLLLELELELLDSLDSLLSLDSLDSLLSLDSLDSFDGLLSLDSLLCLLSLLELLELEP